MYYKEKIDVNKDSAGNVEWHGHHEGKYYNREDPKYKKEKKGGEAR